MDHHHHHCSRYLEQMVLSLNSSHHRNFYKSIPFSCWLQAQPPHRSSSIEPSIFHARFISTEPTLFHAGCTSTKPVLFHTGCNNLPLARISPIDPVLFHTGCNTLPRTRISPTEPVLFHIGCNTLPLQGFPLQSQPFFMLDSVPCLCKDFHYKSSPFSCWMQYLASYI